MPPTASLRRTPVRRRSTERPAGILDARAALPGEAGRDALSIRAVAQGAGVPVGSVCRFFGGGLGRADTPARRTPERFAHQVVERLKAATGAPDRRRAMGVVPDECLDGKRTAPGFSLVDFGHRMPVGTRRAEPDHYVADHLADLLSGYLDREPDDVLRRGLRIAVGTAGALVRPAFRVAPEGDEKIIADLRETLRACPARVLD
ncbi:TetR/AcrR family transcriptional regulator [Streptomyces sp. KMM 9044]|uniref:TetR/AcrR family transcriptional regulator n=1 Tax=Streptomyces sp. KMM 9044 TaxID=2744474 RepID=UPI003FA73A65